MSNPELLTRYYTSIPPLEQVPLRSVHLSPYGPTLKLRLDLPRFADTAPQEWVDAGCDRVECQVSFVATGELRMRGLPAGRRTDMTHAPLDHRRLRVSLRGEGFELDFTCADSLLVSHVNAYRSGDGDPYRARRRFGSRVDQLRYTALPDTTVKPFYDYP